MTARDWRFLPVLNDPEKSNMYFGNVFTEGVTTSEETGKKNSLLQDSQVTALRAWNCG